MIGIFYSDQVSSNPFRAMVFSLYIPIDEDVDWSLLIDGSMGCVHDRDRVRIVDNHTCEFLQNCHQKPFPSYTRKFFLAEYFGGSEFNHACLPMLLS